MRGVERGIYIKFYPWYWVSVLGKNIKVMNQLKCTAIKWETIYLSRLFHFRLQIKGYKSEIISSRKLLV